MVSVYPRSASIKRVTGEGRTTSADNMFDATCNACEMAVTWMQSKFVQNHTKEGMLEYIGRVRLPFDS
jgi:hypothetical protein